MNLLTGPLWSVGLVGLVEFSISRSLNWVIGVKWVYKLKRISSVSNARRSSRYLVMVCYMLMQRTHKLIGRQM